MATYAHARRGATLAAENLGGGANRGDRIFEFGVSVIAACVPILLLGIIALLLLDALPALLRFGFSFLTQTTWDPVGEHFGAAAYIFGTLVTSFLALLLA